MNENDDSPIEINPQETPQASIIWLHGLGADGYDFEPVAQMLQQQLQHPTRFVLPHAPIRPVTLNGGEQMRAWYDMLDLDHPRNVDWDTVYAGEAMLAELINQERETHAPNTRLYLAGFSQGGALALRLGLMRKFPFCGIIALSTYLLQNEGETFPVDKNNKLPLFMAHGNEDPIIPFNLAEATRNSMKQYGLEPEWHEYDMMHSVCPEEVEALAQWLNHQTPESH